ncbi:MAG: hypothetical protein K2Z81_05605 [Cyanobacteria bacterium]|nr:hypothetical protein [Cyanobacteriota bacterium]
MRWPTPQEYNEAIQTPSVCFLDQTLRKARVATNSLGLPLAITGAFASVYRLSSENHDWAVRCFLSHHPDLKERYFQSSQFFSRLENFECIVPFSYLENGIRVRGQWYPIVKMSWIHGQTLDCYLLDNFKNANKIDWLLTQFKKLCLELEGAGIAHGDIQHGNLIVTNQGMQLVDYDALFIPVLAGKTCLELGHPNYQHPSRQESLFDTTMDRFSSWLILISLQLIRIDPQLFELFRGGDDCILFRRTDLLKPESSKLFEHLRCHESGEVRTHALILERMLWSLPSAIPSLMTPYSAVIDLLPDAKPLQVCDSTERVELGREIDRLSCSGVSVSKSKSTKRSVVSRISEGTVGYLKHRRERELKKKRPAQWLREFLQRGDFFVDEGELEKAAVCYASALNEVENSYKLPDIRHEILLKLGYTSELQKNGLAFNYFLLAYQEAVGPSERGRAGFLLALHKFLKNETREALAIVSKDNVIVNSLAQVIDREVRNGTIDRENTLDFLYQLIRHCDPAEENYVSIIYQSSKLFQMMKEYCAFAIDFRALNIIRLHLDSLYPRVAGEPNAVRYPQVESVVVGGFTEFGAADWNWIRSAIESDLSSLGLIDSLLIQMVESRETTFIRARRSCRQEKEENPKVDYFSRLRQLHASEIVYHLRAGKVCNSTELLVELFASGFFHTSVERLVSLLKRTIEAGETAEIVPCVLGTFETKNLEVFSNCLTSFLTRRDTDFVLQLLHMLATCDPETAGWVISRAFVLPQSSLRVTGQKEQVSYHVKTMVSQLFRDIRQLEIIAWIYFELAKAEESNGLINFHRLVHRSKIFKPALPKQFTTIYFQNTFELAQHILSGEQVSRKEWRQLVAMLEQVHRESSTVKPVT